MRFSRWLVALSIAAAAGCSSSDSPLPEQNSSCVVERLSQSAVDKIDLLLMIDNSPSMADKQEILELAVPDLVGSLVNPQCVDNNGVPAATQPPGPVEACPPGTRRAFTPVLDLHIGIISSSLGGHGSDACPTSGAGNPTNDDRGHLLSRLGGGQNAPTYDNLGFLAWDPAQTLTPPGEATIAGLEKNLQDMVLGVGQDGCGYPAQLEAWYRFLVDPAPFDELAVMNNVAVPSGVDQTILQQRKDFLRPSSLLAILMLTGENDCSIRDGGPYFYAAQGKNGNAAFHLPRGRQACAANPNDACCYSCASDDKDGCTPKAQDTECVKGDYGAEDDLALRCWDQKRRFGIDFLYPVGRYVNALTQPAINPKQPDLALKDGQPSVANPIFSDLVPTDGDTQIRDPGLVFLAGVVGVPWQDIARNPTDLTAGFKSGEELQQPLPNVAGNPTTWDVILGEPSQGVLPLDPLMIESVAPRSGSNPITGDPIAPPGSPPDANHINGHEWIPNGDDLQYACIFPLLTPKDCAATTGGCDCDGTNDSALCTPVASTTQTAAKAYPGLRELEVLRGLEAQGLVGSICPAQTTMNTSPSFGYRPAIGGLVERLRAALSGQCLPHKLTPDANGTVACMVLEARKVDGPCDCSGPGRAPVAAEHAPAVTSAKQDPKNPGWNCFCEIQQLQTAALQACKTDPSVTPVVDGQNVDGWCYVDPTAPGGANPDLVEDCPESEQHLLRFVGAGQPSGNSTTFITCCGG